MSFQGCLKYNIIYEEYANIVRPLHIKLTQPEKINSAKLFYQKKPHEVLRVLPMIFSICGMAHCHTASIALKGAHGKNIKHQQYLAQLMLVKTEHIREQIYRIIMIFCNYLDAKCEKILKRILGAVSQLQNSLYGNQKPFEEDVELKIDSIKAQKLLSDIEQFCVDEVFQSNIANFKDISTLQELKKYLSSNNSPSSEVLQYLTSIPGSFKLYYGAELPAFPKFDPFSYYKIACESYDNVKGNKYSDKAFETGALINNLNHPLISELIKKSKNGLFIRFCSRLIDLAEKISELKSDYKKLCEVDCNEEYNLSDYQLEGNCGFAECDTFRGKLIHICRLDEGLVTNYNIISPTEVNFQNAGIVEQALKRINANNIDELRLLSNLTIEMIDPCIKYELEVCAHA